MKITEITQENMGILDVPSVCSKITTEENKFRHLMADAILQEHAPYAPKNAEEKALIESLQGRNVLAADEQGVYSLYPVSAISTSKKVVLDDGREGFAMCAVDAIGFYYTFGQGVRIRAKCEHTGEEIVLRMDDQGLAVEKGGDRICVLYRDLRNCETWSCCCCNIMHFFRDKEALDAWCDAHLQDTTDVYQLTLAQARQLAENLFAE